MKIDKSKIGIHIGSANKFRLYRMFVTGEIRDRYLQNLWYSISSGCTHLICIEQIINGDVYSSASREIIYPSMLRETINQMLKEIEKMKLHLNKEKK